MNNIFESISNTSDKAADIGEKYLKDTQEYYRLKIFQQLSLSISMVAKAFIIGGLLFIGLIFLSVSSALAIGAWIDNAPLGYLIVGAVFIVFSIVMYYNRKFISRGIVKQMSPRFFN